MSQSIIIMFHIVLQVYFISILCVHARRSPLAFIKSWLALFQSMPFQSSQASWYLAGPSTFKPSAANWYLHSTNPPYLFKGTSQSWCNSVYSNRLSPNCTCDGPSNYRMINCKSIDDINDLLIVINSDIGGDDFGQFLFNESNLLILKSKEPINKRFKNIIIRKTNVVQVNLDMFRMSNQTLKRVEIVPNNLINFPFSNLSLFTNLANLDLYYNALRIIPDRAFEHCSSLETIDLSFNHIFYIGSFAFQNMTKLRQLDLKHNKLKVVNNHAFATRWSNRNLLLDLSHNEMFFLAKDCFEGQYLKELDLSHNWLTKLDRNIFVPILRSNDHRVTLKVYENRFQCKCKHVEWILALTSLEKSQIEGFNCKVMNRTKPLNELTLHDIECLPNHLWPINA